MKNRFAFALISAALLLGIPAGAQTEKAPAAGKPTAEAKTQKTKEQARQLIAVVHPTAGNKVRGTVVFKPLGDGMVEVTARLTGLEPMGRHGFHVHQYGDLTGTDGSTAGGHFNPEGHEHGLPPEQKRHAGDLGNLRGDEDGRVDRTIVVENLRLTGKHSILGRAVIVHAKADTGEQPSGTAGDRIGYGVIGYRFQPDVQE